MHTAKAHELFWRQDSTLEPIAIILFLNIYPYISLK